MKKTISVLLALMLVMSLCSAALADNNTITQQANTVGAAGWKVTWTDTFKVAEGDTSTQNLPAATFNYAITAGTAQAAVDQKSPKINAGIVVDGAPTISVQGVHAAKEVGTISNSVDVTADFTGLQSKFTEAGIYRYNVKETLASSNSSADIKIDVGNGNSGDYILDVYVKKVKGENDTVSFEPYAYVLSKAGKINSFKDKEEGGTTVLSVEYDGKVREIVNELTTYDLTITKEIEGDVAANKFEFTIEIGGVPTDVYIKKDSDTAVKGGSTITFNEVWLADGQSTTIVGLPSIATYAIQEAVNKLEGYTVEVTENKADKTVAAGAYGWIGTDANGNASVVMGEGDVDVTFKNELKNISPTGVVLRVAPYVLILVAGVALLMISRRRKTERE